LVAIIANGCGTSAEEMDAKAKSSLSECQRRGKPWVGKTEVELLQTLGAPVRTASDGKDGKILEFDSEVELGKKENVGGFGRTQYTLTVKNDFFVDRDGKIYLANCLEGPVQTKPVD
jgi:hypothetical protein